MANYLIIAGTSTIGSCVIKKLYDAGHHLYFTSRNQLKAETIAAAYQAQFSIIEATDFLAIEAAFENAIHYFGDLDGVVNCAGSLLLKPAHLTTYSEYQEIISANLTTAFATVHASGKYLNKKGGSIVLISSAAAKQGFANHEAIAAAKAGIIGLTLSAAATYAASNIRFNAVAPGLTETSLTHAMLNNPMARKASTEMHALGRIGTPEDIANAIVFFLQPENNWITGQILAVDGGISRIQPRIKI